jgi:hypothetical protein
MSANITSQPTVIQNTSKISYDVSWVGSAPVGTLQVQVSNSYTQNSDGSVKNAGNWTTLTLDVTPTVSGNTGNGFIDLLEMASYAVRLVYVRTSGTGVMTAIIAGKVS